LAFHSQLPHQQLSNVRLTPYHETMQLTTLFALALAGSGSLVSASNCNKGLLYCGYNLLSRGMLTSSVSLLSSYLFYCHPHARSIFFIRVHLSSSSLLITVRSHRRLLHSDRCRAPQTRPIYRRQLHQGLAVLL
jgi:hypothetical protein